MKKNFIVVVLLILVISTTRCINKGPTSTNTLSVKAVSSELKIVPSSEQVEDFLSKNKDFASIYETDICYDITPDFVANNSEFSIFKYNMSARSFLLFDDEIHTLGGGVTSVALGDLDNDNKYELYFTFGWGSGIYRSQIGYFNPSTKKVVVFDYQNFNYDMILTTNNSETSLLVNEATISYNSPVEFSIKSNKLMGKFISEEGNVKQDLIKK